MREAVQRGLACVIVKHANPCGVALGANLLEAYDRAYQTDPESAFGGIIACNRELDAATAQAIVDRQFVEVIIAPKVTPEAVAIVAAKKNVRLLECGPLAADAGPRLDMKRVNGGLLVQEADLALFNELKVVNEASRHRAGDGGSALCLAGGQIRQIQRHRLRQRQHDHRRRSRPDEPGQLGANRRHQGRTCRARR